MEVAAAGTKLEVDEAWLANRWVQVRLHARLDSIIAEVVGKFKGGRLTQDDLTQLRADWLATGRLMREIDDLAKGGTNG